MVEAAVRFVPTPQETRRRVDALRRRSLGIHFLRGALPTVTAVLLAVVIGWAAVNSLGALQPATKSAGDIRMVGPEFHGRSKDGRPYVVTAESADRDPVHPERVAMVRPRLSMETADRGRVLVHAQAGAYDENSKILTLFGGVVLDTDRGEHFESPAARVDTAARTAVGDRGVVASGPMGVARAEAYSIDDKSGQVVLHGNVHTRLQTRGAGR